MGATEGRNGNLGRFSAVILNLFTVYAVRDQLGSESFIHQLRCTFLLPNPYLINSSRVYFSLGEKGGTIRVSAEADRSQSSVRWGPPRRVEALFFVIVSFIAGEFVG